MAGEVGHHIIHLGKSTDWVWDWQTKPEHILLLCIIYGVQYNEMSQWVTMSLRDIIPVQSSAGFARWTGIM